MIYSYKTFFQKLYQMQEQQFSFTAQDKEKAMAWQAMFRKKLSEKLGLNRLTKIGALCSAKQAVLLEETQENGYLRRKYVLQTLPDVYMPFYMLIPDNVKEDNPGKGIIAIPAHGANKNTVCNVGQTKEEREKIQSALSESYGEEFVRRGYVVFCPDPPGYGERVEPISMEEAYFTTGKKRSSLETCCKDLAQTAEAFGLSLIALYIHDLTKLLDFVCDCAEVKQTDRKAVIGCAGFSGGGQYSMWLAAMDERIRLAVVSGYVHGYYDSIMECHLCSCNYAPGLWELGDISDICSLIAPRPLFVENGTRDIENGPNGIEGPIDQAKKIQNAYKLLGAENKLFHFMPEGIHRWYGGCYDFIEKNL